ncbi:hypothetical protein POL68_40395 [Stigmatella sp. ncwal1]|uniref:Uncharacterized protein n=1 Tax=Stigmatella ashevillensis TaxID=2995309 RepID=A0ABT5DM90_9BACT|nr:hypothetical protein [Stigmatella ashevillena]MDC0714779.1 hypothetical protein [Stigmatella ashevillena]
MVYKLVGLLCLCLASAAAAQDSAAHSPVVTLYGKGGKADVLCTLPLTNSKGISFKNSDAKCPDDKAYFFSVARPADGMEIGLYDSETCDASAPYSSYKVTGHVEPGKSTRLLSVDAAGGVPAGKVIADSLAGNGNNKSGPLRGKVSCVTVSGAP